MAKRGTQPETDALSEAANFIKFMRDRGLDVRLSADGQKIELFSRMTGKRLCFFPVTDLEESPE